MNISYIVETEKDPRIKAWFCGLDERLRNRRGLLFEGAAHSVGKDGLYAISIDIILVPLLIGPIMFMVGGIAAWMIFHSVGWSNWLVAIGACLMTIVYVILSPPVHVFVMRRTFRHLTSKKVKVEIQTREAIRRLAYGEV